MSNETIVVTLRLTPSDPKAFEVFLAEILPDTRKAKGCRYCTTFTVQGDGADFLLVQEWDSLADQQAYMAWRGETGVLEKFLGHLAKPADVAVWDRSSA